MQEALIFDLVRTPRGKGKPSGALYEVKPIDLLTTCLEALRKRNHFETSFVDDVLIGCVTPVGDQGFNIARTSLLNAGWDYNVSGIQLNRLCASGLEAVNFAAMRIRAGWEHLFVAGGVESMSRVPIGSDGGPLLFDPEFTEKIGYVPQGISADLIAALEQFDRKMLDEYALRSHDLANQAWENGHFRKSIIPIHDRNGILLLDKDEDIRPDTNLEQLAALPSAFKTNGELGYDTIAMAKYPELESIPHVHTAGNSCGIVDGASTILLGSPEIAEKLDIQPRAKIIATANTSVDPTLMLTGAISASRLALKRASMEIADIDLWECNEAFAAIPLKFQQALNIDLDKLNVNGGAIAMGHPLGATGAMLMGKLVDELERRDLKTGLVTIGVGSGMGVATVIERV